MRLTCPRCGAQYEIAAAAIPAAGREVECSACSHVWFQPGQPKAAAPYDPQARPALNRPLNESVLAILRDETARELQARQTDAGKRAADSDQNLANSAADAAPTVPAASGNVASADADAGPVAPPVAPPVDAPAMADADWPATTLTATPAGPVSSDPVPPRQAPAKAAAESLADTPVEIAEAPSQEAPEPAPFEAPAPALETPAPDEDAPRPEPVVAALPDAAELAATLTRPGPPPALSPAGARRMPDAAEPAAEDTAAPVAASLPVVTAAKRGSGYASGFGLAAMLALGVVAVYALAPRVAADEDGGLLAEWRQEIDRGRLWLHERIIGE